VIGHAHSIRGLIKILKGLSDEEVQNMACIPNCVPIVLELDQDNKYIQDYTLGDKDELKAFISDVQ